MAGRWETMEVYIDDGEAGSSSSSTSSRRAKNRGKYSTKFDSSGSEIKPSSSKTRAIARGNLSSNAPYTSDAGSNYRDLNRGKFSSRFDSSGRQYDPWVERSSGSRDWRPAPDPYVPSRRSNVRYDPLSSAPAPQPRNVWSPQGSGRDYTRQESGGPIDYYQPQGWRPSMPDAVSRGVNNAAQSLMQFRRPQYNPWVFHMLRKSLGR